MFRIAKNLVRTFEQSVSDTIGAGTQLDSYFESVPPNLLSPGNNTNELLHGLRVLACDESQVQLQSFFDYIIGIDDQPLPLSQNQHGYLYPDFGSITRLLNAACGSSVKLNLWSGKGGVYRDEYIRVERKKNVEDVPLDGSRDVVFQEFDALGFAVQWTPLTAATYTYHVLELSDPTGPAAQAGFVPQEDYVVGCQEGLLATGGETLLQDILRSHAGQDLVLYVFNAVSDCIRPVTVHVGHDGRLGCNMGYGFLHRIPAPFRQEPASAVEASFADAPMSDQSFVPAGSSNIGIPQPSTDIQPTSTSQFIVPNPTHKRKQKHHKVAAAASIQDYFQEGKDPSPAFSTKSSSTPPPPPPVKNQDTTK